MGEIFKAASGKKNHLHLPIHYHCFMQHTGRLPSESKLTKSTTVTAAAPRLAAGPGAAAPVQGRVIVLMGAGAGSPRPDCTVIAQWSFV